MVRVNTKRRMGRSVLIIGAGLTGVSAARFLQARGCAVRLADSRDLPPGRAALARLPEPVPCHFGAWNPAALMGVDEVLVSPGVAPEHPALAGARAVGLPIYGDIELFARHAARPVLAVTGTNGKSTVASLTAALLKASGVQAVLGGNIGVPALDLLDGPEPDCYVLELSSYQLETVSSLRDHSAAVLNFTPDHLDRYGTVAAYGEAKARILLGARRVVLNSADPWVAALAEQLAPHQTLVRFADAAPRTDRDFGVERHGDTLWLMRGRERLMATDRLPLPGGHNRANVLAALALASDMAADWTALVRGVTTFKPLAHRLQRVGQAAPAWWNDSKATNVASAIAAIEAVAETGAKPLVLIAGGLGKGQDFTPLAGAVRGRVESAVLLGASREELARILAPVCQTRLADSIEQAVAIAAELAAPAGAVLLAPACASQDQFRDYADRGHRFAEAVAQYEAGADR